MEMNKMFAMGLAFFLAGGMALPGEAARKKPATASSKPVGSWVEQARKKPAAYDTATPEAQMTSETLSKWWGVFQDPKLDALIDSALKNNRDLEAAQARVEEARAQLGIAKGEMLPWFDLGGGWSRSELPKGVASKALPGGADVIKRNNQSSHLGIDASWEPDFFGRLKAGKQAAVHDLAAQHAALYSTWVTLSAETALNYMSLRTLQADLAIVQRHAALEDEKTQLLQDNFDAGLISGYPVESMRTQQKSTAAEIPKLKESIQETLTRLSVLTGTELGQLDDLLTPQDLPQIDPCLYHAIPAENLRQRPDIYEAEQKLAAQVARTKEARAELKPRFTLEGFLGLLTLGGTNLFSSAARGFALAPSFAMPLFHGGTLRQNVKYQDAKAREYQAEYENAVLKAAGEVQDAMTSIVQEKERKDSLYQGTASAQEALDLAESQYQAGLSDYQPVLDSERTLLTLKRRTIQSRGQELADLIHLFKALGGGWKPLTDEENAKIANPGGKVS